MCRQIKFLSTQKLHAAVAETQAQLREGGISGIGREKVWHLRQNFLPGMIDFSVCRYRKCILMRANNAGCGTGGKSAGRYGVGSADTVYTLFVLTFSILRTIVQSADEVIVQIVQTGCR